jgi:hypothetical protein
MSLFWNIWEAFTVAAYRALDDRHRLQRKADVSELSASSSLSISASYCYFPLAVVDLDNNARVSSKNINR